MDLWFILGAVLKMAFILGVALLFYAPVFVLFERRQSAFMQDRLGPYMGGIKMPAALMERLPTLQYGGFASAIGAALTALLAAVMIALGDASEPALFFLPFSWGTLFLLAAIGAPVQYVGAKVLPHLFYRDRLNIFGGLHALFDALKAFTKEDIIPPHADKFLYAIAPILAMIPAFSLGAVVPFGPDVHFDWLFDQLPEGGAISGPVAHLQVASLNIGILYIFALGGAGVISAAIAGYSSDNKFALLGGIRAASQMVSYEVTLGLSLVGCFMLFGTLRLEEMVAWQMDHAFLGILPGWGIFYQPLAFVLFFTASMAEYKRIPFDVPEGESEIVAGYFLEYSSGKWLMWMISEFLEIAVSSMVIATIFLGGWDVPGLTQSGWRAFGYRFDLSGTNWAFLSEIANSHLFVTLVSIVAFLAKAFVLGVLSLQVRWTLPRFRYDQIMQLCWKILLPLSLLNVLVTGVAILLFS